MSINAQGSVFSIAPQSGKVGKGVFDGSAHSFRKMRASRVSFGTKQNQQQFPDEIGGLPVPTGAYKQGVYGAGDVDFIPRMENVLGYVLWAALGHCDTTNNAKYHPVLGSVPASNVNLHHFRFSPDSPYNVPWIGVRVHVPGRTAGDSFGEEAYDGMVNSLRLNIPAAGILQASFGLQARCVTYPLAATVNGWTYVNNYEDSLSVPHSGKGQFLIGGQRYPITGATVEFMNDLTSPEEEMVVADYYPDDFMTRNRSARVRITYKWENPQLYRRMLTGAPIEETEWNAIPFLQETQGATKALDILFQSPGTIPNTSPALPYSLRIVANRVVWEIDRGGIELAPGNIIQVPFIGTLLEPAAGQEYIQIFLENGATYTFSGPNLAPVLEMPDFQAYTSGAVTIAPSATASDVDSTDLNSGTLTVTLGGNDLSPDDELSIGEIGLITVDGGDVEYNNIVIGSFTGDGQPGTPLVVTFNSASNPDRITELLRAIQYTRGSGAVDGEVVTATFVLTDGDGGTSQAAVVTIVDVESGGETNPVLTVAASLTYSGSSFTTLDATATVTDADSLNFAGGTLTVQMSGDDLALDDELQVGAVGLITLDDDEVLYDGIVVGTVEGDGQTGTPLIVTFNGAATPTRVQAVVRAVQYRRSGGEDNGEEVTVTFTLADGDGGTSTPDAIVVTHETV